MTGNDQPPFKVFRAFNDPELAPLARLRSRMHERALPGFVQNGPPGRIAAALAERRVVPVKEVLESFEFHHRVRRRIRAPHMADLCAGHGLTGLLFAAEPSVHSVTLVDRRRPPSFDKALDAVASVVPGVRDKVRYLELEVSAAAAHLERGTALIAVHACGSATDDALALAQAVNGAIAAMPCCHQKADRFAPAPLRGALGSELAADVDRTYRMRDAGFDVDWAWIPKALTPMNRILVAQPG